MVRRGVTTNVDDTRLVLAPKIVRSLRAGREVYWMTDLDNTLKHSPPESHRQLQLSEETLSAATGFAEIPGCSIGILTMRDLDFVRDLPKSIDLYGSMGLQVRFNGHFWSHPDVARLMMAEVLTLTGQFTAAADKVELHRTGDPAKAVAANKRGVDTVFVEFLNTGLIIHTAQAGENRERVERKLDLVVEELNPNVRRERAGPRGPSDLTHGLIYRNLGSHRRFDIPLLTRRGHVVTKAMPVKWLKAAEYMVMFSGDDEVSDLPAACAADFSVAIREGGVPPDPRKADELVRHSNAVLENPGALTELLIGVTADVRRSLGTEPPVLEQSAPDLLEQRIGAELEPAPSF